jgi:hypothetical protein
VVTIYINVNLIIVANFRNYNAQISFYALYTCNDTNIYFGAFSALISISSSTQFSLTDSSNALSVDRTSDTDNSMKLVTISLCVGSTSVGCQGKAFQINSGQYFGSYSPQCVMGFAPTSSSIYPSTYYQQSSNPFSSGAQPAATYINNYPNVVLQYIKIERRDTAGQTPFCFFSNSFGNYFCFFFRVMHFNNYTSIIQFLFYWFMTFSLFYSLLINFNVFIERFKESVCIPIFLIRRMKIKYLV